VLDTDRGPRRGLQVTVPRDGRTPLIAKWGGISLARDITPRPLNDDPAHVWSRRSEVVQRLLADVCEQCGSGDQVEVHHIRALKDLNPKVRTNLPDWATRMAARCRKTLVGFRACHEALHAGRPTPILMSTGEPAARMLRPVRRLPERVTSGTRQPHPGVQIDGPCPSTGYPAHVRRRQDYCDRSPFRPRPSHRFGQSGRSCSGRVRDDANADPTRSST
jgi:hypothetical protein